MSTGLQYRPQSVEVTPPGTMEVPVCFGLLPAKAMASFTSGRTAHFGGAALFPHNNWRFTP